MRTLIRTAALALALLPPAALAAQQTPEQAAQAYFQHLRAGNIEAITGAIHPAAMQSLKDSLLPFAAALGARGEGGGPFDGAEMQAMNSLAPEALFQLVLVGLFTEVELESSQAALTIRPLGTVAAGPDLAHVVYAVDLPVSGHAVELRQVLTMRRHQGAWKVDPGAGVSTLVNAGLLPLLISAAIAEELEGRGGEDDDDDGR